MPRHPPPTTWNAPASSWRPAAARQLARSQAHGVGFQIGQAIGWRKLAVARRGRTARRRPGEGMARPRRHGRREATSLRPKVKSVARMERNAVGAKRRPMTGSAKCEGSGITARLRLGSAKPASRRRREADLRNFPSFGKASGARANAARASLESSSMRRTRSSMLSNLSSGLIQSMKATSMPRHRDRRKNRTGRLRAARCLGRTSGAGRSSRRRHSAARRRRTRTA